MRTMLRLMHGIAMALLLVVFSQTTSGQGIPDPSKKEKADAPRAEIQVGNTVEVPVNDSNYVVGPADVLNLSIYTDRYYSYDVVVSTNGRIIVPQLGDVVVNNLSLASVRDVLKQLIDRNFKNAELIVSLARPRQIKVSITGAVMQPGVILLPATARVSEALEIAGGIAKDTTALRGIMIKRGKQTLTADLISFYRFGETSTNPFLMGGDVVVFSRIDRRVSIFGAVNYEGHIDYLPGDKLFDIIRIAGGFRSSVFLDSVQIVRFKEDNTTTENYYLNLHGYPTDESVNIPLAPSDLILVRSIPKFQHQRLVLITGEVKYPGSYPIEKGDTRLTEIIARAGGFTSDASLEEATVTTKRSEGERDQEFERLSKIPPSEMGEDEYEYFKARSRERVGQMVVNFKRLFLENDLKEDIILQDGDVIDVPLRKNYIRVIGRVINPGNVIFRRGWSFLDYINASGGFGWRANESDVRIVKARTGELVDAEKISAYELEPGDTIWVPEEVKSKFWEVAIETVGVLSQVAGILGIIIAITRF